MNRRFALVFSFVLLISFHLTTAPTRLSAEEAPVITADDIPIAKTPPEYWKVMPPPVLAGCNEPIVEGAPDMRGFWKVVEATTANGKSFERMLGMVQRIEQCGNRVVVTAGGVTHDMRCDGTYENGVNDLGENGMMISVAASYEKGVHVLRPKGMPITVEREVVDGELIWRYGPINTRSVRVPTPTVPLKRGESVDTPGK